MKKKMYRVKIKFNSGHVVYKNAGSDYSLAYEIMRNNEIEYRFLDCKISLEQIKG